MTMVPGTDEVGKNWAGTYHYTAREVALVKSADEVASIVAQGDKVKALGTRHSFNDLADTTGTLVDVSTLEFEPVIDEVNRRVTAPAGMSYGTLGRFLQERGWALHNLGSLPHISVGGACATGTHGSGSGNQNLATAVCCIELVAGRGRKIVLDEGDARFLGCVVALGALGVVTSVTLRIEPTYNVRQDVFIDMPWEDLKELDTIMDSAYSVSLFTRWNGVVDQVWLKSRVEEGNPEPSPPGVGATPAAGKVMSPADDGRDNTTVQGGVPGPWNERLPHFRFDETPSNGDEIQSEYFVARKDGLAALRALEPIADQLAPHLLISEFRTVAADRLWLSPAYERDSLTIHFTWKNRPEEVRRLLPTIEEALKPFNARPHWGKWFSMDKSEIAAFYERLPDFIELAREFDPEGQFRNDYLARTTGLN
jgi:xylitol oxidase